MLLSSPHPISCILLCFRRQDLAAALRASLADESTEQLIRAFVDPELVIVDELTFLPLDRLLADTFYRIVASRYERSSLIISNKNFESWAEPFPDAVIFSAVLDRLVPHANLIAIIGEGSPAPRAVFPLVLTCFVQPLRPEPSGAGPTRVIAPLTQPYPAASPAGLPPGPRRDARYCAPTEFARTAASTPVPRIG